jgi:hypothetical protein
VYSRTSTPVLGSAGHQVLQRCNDHRVVPCARAPREGRAGDATARPERRRDSSHGECPSRACLSAGGTWPAAGSTGSRNLSTFSTKGAGRLFERLDASIEQVHITKLAEHTRQLEALMMQGLVLREGGAGSLRRFKLTDTGKRLRNKSRTSTLGSSASSTSCCGPRQARATRTAGGRRVAVNCPAIPLVAPAGLEPASPCGRGILNPLRLPFRQGARMRASFGTALMPGIATTDCPRKSTRVPPLRRTGPAAQL